MKPLSASPLLNRVQTLLNCLGVVFQWFTSCGNCFGNGSSLATIAAAIAQLLRHFSTIVETLAPTSFVYFKVGFSTLNLGFSTSSSRLSALFGTKSILTFGFPTLSVSLKQLM